MYGLSDPCVNVVVRVFNGEMWLRSCLANLSIQNYSNFTVTVVDSGSVDKLLDIAAEFKQKPNLKIIGKKSLQDIPSDELLSLEMFE
jgi:glycosyltransferase involved in cell wall biosynthesis